MNNNQLISKFKECLTYRNNTLNLIASENYPSREVLAYMSDLTYKYAEGYPHNRYYGGCKFIDDIECLAITELTKLFKVSYANVQPHSGSQANQAVIFGLLNPGDTILSLDLSSGGHLTHGHPLSLIGKFFKIEHYNLNSNYELDYNAIENKALSCKPKLIIAGYSSYSGLINWEAFARIATKCSCYLLADIAHVAGLIAGNCYPSPVNYADVITGSTHKVLRGPRGGFILTNNLELSKKIDKTLFPGIQGGPCMHTIAAKAQCFWEASQPSYHIYCQKVISNAQKMAEVFKKNNLKLIGQQHTHLVLLSLIDSPKSGLIFQNELEEVGIITNKNVIPGDHRAPKYTSGLRIGTAAITTQGIDKIEEIAQIMVEVLNFGPQDNHRSLVTKLTKKWPIP